MTDTVILSTTFDIAIPEAIRSARGWRPGQKFVFLPKGEGLLLTPVPERDELEGVARGASHDDYRDRRDRQG